VTGTDQAERRPSVPHPILDPTGGGRPAAAAAAGLEPADRPADLRGATIGLLENTKHNAALLLDEIGALLVSQHGADRVVRRTKTVFALPVPDELRDELAASCDVVVVGVGDCGSCSASAIADGIVFEQSSVPAVVICSDAFTVTSDAMADLRGAPGYRYLTTPHPVASLDAVSIRKRATELLPGIVAGLTAGGHP
jgi:hypothetical protein